MSAAIIPLFREEELPSWRIENLYGRLVELTGREDGAQLTAAFSLVRLAQEQREPVALVQLRHHTFFPPDASAGGIDLDSLVVIRVAAANDLTRAAEQLVRSGAFGLVVIDLGENAQVPMPLLTRLAGLAKKHSCAVVFLTTKRPELPSLGSLVSLRGDVRLHRVSERTFEVVVRMTKDKHRAPNWEHGEVCLGPPGLC
ncbi:MAG: recombinase A [Myxococcota bacterium]